MNAEHNWAELQGVGTTANSLAHFHYLLSRKERFKIFQILQTLGRMQADTECFELPEKKAVKVSLCYKFILLWWL